MPASFLSFVTSGSGNSEPTSPVFFIVLAVAIAVAVTVMQRFASKRNKKATEAVLAQSASDAAVDGDPTNASSATSEPVITFTVAPARPLPEDVAALRALLGESSPELRITRYTRPVVVVSSESISLSDPKSGAFLTIPAGDVVGVTAGKESLRPQGSLPITRAALTVTVRRADASQTIVLAPITGMYDGLPLAQVQSLAGAVRDRLGFSAE